MPHQPRVLLPNDLARNHKWSVIRSVYQQAGISALRTLHHGQLKTTATCLGLGRGLQSRAAGPQSHHLPAQGAQLAPALAHTQLSHQYITYIRSYRAHSQLGNVFIYVSATWVCFPERLISALFLSPFTDCLHTETVLNSQTASGSFISSLSYFPFTQGCNWIGSGSYTWFWEEARTRRFGEFILTPSKGVFSLVIFLEPSTHQQLMTRVNENKGFGFIFHPF